MPSCKCGAAVTIAETEGGEKIVLEAYSEPTGADRYTLRFHAATVATPFWGGLPPTAIPLDGSSPIDGYSNHKVRCPFQR